jgi:hypothetical protein
MISILSTLLLVSSTTAQLTTSIALLKAGFGTDKLGFYASVIGVSGPNTTLAVVYDNGTNTEALGLATKPQTMTVGPNMFEIRTNVPIANGSNSFILHCDLPVDAEPDCNASYDPVLARGILCPASARTTGTRYLSVPHTYSARGSYAAGVETIVRTFVYGVNTRERQSWCTDRSYVPSSGYSYKPTIKKEDVGMYQVIVTAGEEKLKATQGASGSGASVTPTGAMGSGAGSASTGAAMPMKTVGPVVAGLGAFAAAFL